MWQGLQPYHAYAYQVTPHASAIVRRLEDSEWVVRKSALWVLRRLPQASACTTKCFCMYY